MEHFDAIVIGSGQGGTPLARKLAEAGWKTVLVEKKYVGGTCINTGCTPTKTMIASARAAYDIAQAAKYGIETGSFTINPATILGRKNEVVQSFRNGSQKRLEETPNLTLLFGVAAFTGPKQVKVMLNNGIEKSLTAGKIFINTGARPSIPQIPGLETVNYLTSETILDLAEIPGHLLVIGGGYIALELGQMYRRFGSQVTILESGDRFLAREDEDVAAEIEKFLTAENIIIHTGAKVTEVKSTGTEIQLKATINATEQTIACSHLLVAAGRKPDTESLNLQAAGVNTNEKGEITVNDKLETTARDIYAIGDVKGGPQFTHISYNDYIILAGNLLQGQNLSVKNRMVPYCMFTDPQLGRIGITEQEAQKQGLHTVVTKLPMENVARAIETGNTRGFMKAVADKNTGKILGAAIVGREGGETMSLLQMAMAGNIGYKQLASMIFAHPLYAESINNLFMQLEG